MKNLNYIPEKTIINSAESIPIKVLKIIFKQTDECLCKIECNKGGTGTGFLCIIPFPNKLQLLPVLITNNHVVSNNDILNNNKIKFKLNDESFELALDETRKIYNDENYDITMIEIKKADRLKINSFLEIDELIFEPEPRKQCKDKKIYLIHFAEGKDPLFSLGKIHDINEDNYTIEHLCNSQPGSSGCPIIDYESKKVIGIHKGSSKEGNWNIGALMKEPIEKFYEEKGSHNDNNINNLNKIEINHEIYNKVKNSDIDEITMVYKYKEFEIENDLKNKIEEELEETISVNKILGENFVKRNKSVCKLIIDGESKELCSYLSNNDFMKNKGEIEIKLSGIKKIIDASFISGCISLISLPDIDKWNTSRINNMRGMFLLCSSLSYLSDISKWDTKNVSDILGIFQGCSSLSELPDI